MNEQVRTQFNTLSSEYDSFRRLLIPDFDAFYGTGIDCLKYGGAAPAALDVGAGTGIFAARLLQRYPAASVALLDFADNMIEEAREKFAGNQNISYILGDYSETDLGTNNYDIVISALSLHHLNPAGKRDFFVRLFAALKDGGEFVNADIVKHSDEELTARHDAEWTEFVHRNIGDGERYDRFLASKDVDDPSTIEEQLAWLKAAGFQEARCIYENLNFAVIYAAK